MKDGAAAINKKQKSRKDGKILKPQESAEHASSGRYGSTAAMMQVMLKDRSKLGPKWGRTVRRAAMSLLICIL
ncbi:hypothetical protein Tco_1418903 [Tanacetum coccineum]